MIKECESRKVETISKGENGLGTSKNFHQLKVCVT